MLLFHVYLLENAVSFREENTDFELLNSFFSNYSIIISLKDLILFPCFLRTVLKFY